MTGGAGGVSITAADLQRLQSSLPQLTRDMRNQLRRELKAAANKEADGVRSRVVSGHPGASARVSSAAADGRHRVSYTAADGSTRRRSVHTSLRRRIAKAVTVESKLSSRAAGATIEVKKAKLVTAGAWKGAAHDWDSPTGWRHPVYRRPNRPDVWVQQRGHSFFRNPLNDRRADISRDLAAAMTRFMSRHNL